MDSQFAVSTPASDKSQPTIIEADLAEAELLHTSPAPHSIIDRWQSVTRRDFSSSLIVRPNIMLEYTQFYITKPLLRNQSIAKVPESAH